MAELLKNMFNYDSLHEIAVAIQKEYTPFQIDSFLSSIFDNDWNDLELKARARRISLCLKEYLPVDYKEALMILESSLPSFPIAFFFPDFVEVYGQDKQHWDLSVGALERNTQFWSSEFAVRAFIINDEQRMMKQMLMWSKSDNEHIRRLSSEGCRPLLPWAQSLPKFKVDPTPILVILEELKEDSSLYVRKSVANNLNDISKNHSELVLNLAQKWIGKSKDTDWILKHGCRTLLKKGNKVALALFHFDDVSSVNVTDFMINKSVVSLGEDLIFSFNINSQKTTKVRLEYAIDYVKSNRKTSRKIFQLSEILLSGNKEYTRKHSFQDLSTRKHYPGIHKVTLIINGMERGTLDFELKKGL